MEVREPTHAPQVAPGGYAGACASPFLRERRPQGERVNTSMPDSLQLAEDVDRRSGLTLEQFQREYEIPNRPVILTDVVGKWPAMRKWNRAFLER